MFYQVDLKKIKGELIANRFYMFTTQFDRVKFDPTESNDSKWISFAEFEQMPQFQQLAHKIKSIKRL